MITMLSRANGSRTTMAEKGQQPEQDLPGSLRRAKSMSSALKHTHLIHGITRSEMLTPEEQLNQARAAAAKAFKNDILRRSESDDPDDKGFRTPRRQQSVRFKTTPPVDPDHHPYGMKDEDGSKFGYELTPCPTRPPEIPQAGFSESPYIPTVASSYRRLRRSRSLFSGHLRSYTNPCPISERLHNTTANLKPHRSMSFLRGGTEFMPASYRREQEQLAAQKEKKQPYFTGFSSLRGPKHLPQMDGIAPEKPRSLRMKVRKMSASLLSSVRRAFAGRDSGTEPEMPAQHVVSSRQYFGDYTHSSQLMREQGNASQDIFMSRVNSAVPSIQRASSSIGYPSCGSIRIVTPPGLSSTPLSSSGNTWATSTVSTLRSGTSKRLTIIPEGGPKNGEGKAGFYHGDKAFDRQRVYSAFLRVSRAKHSASGSEDHRQVGTPEPERKQRSPSVHSRSTVASTIKRCIATNDATSQSSIGGYGKTPTPSSTPTPVPVAVSQKENIPQACEGPQKVTRTRIKIGPRITLYPPPSPTQADSSLTKSSVADRGDDDQPVEPVVKSARHMHSTFFPYNSASLVKIGSSPSPFKRLRAAAFSPDAPSMYSRTTSGETPRPSVFNFNPGTPTPRSSPSRPMVAGLFEGHPQPVQLGRKGSLVLIHRNEEEFFNPSTTPPSQTITPTETMPRKTASPPSATSASTFHTANTTRRDENVPFSTYLPGLTRPGETVLPEQVPPTTSTALRVFSKARLLGTSRRDVVNELKSEGNPSMHERNETTPSKTPKSQISPMRNNAAKPLPLSGIDSNIDAASAQKPTGGWGVNIGKRIFTHHNHNHNDNRNCSLTQTSAGIGFGRRRRANVNVNMNAVRLGRGIGNIPPSRTHDEDAEGEERENAELSMLDFATQTTASKYSFESNDERGFSISRGAEQKGDIHESGLMQTMEDPSRNMSISSGIGAFL